MLGWQAGNKKTEEVAIIAITISTHNGSAVSLEHNRRNKKMVENENRKWAKKHPGELRIDPNGDYEIWQDEDIKDAYNQLFGNSIKEYNEKQLSQGKKDRGIKNYLSLIKSKEGTSKNSKHPIYEIIYQVGAKDSPVPDEIAKCILKEMADGFKERNPSLHVLGCYYHGDEVGGVHVHLSYIPVARDCKKGPSIQNSLSSALRQQGITATAYYDTEQIVWERKENKVLEDICVRYGYEVIHPERGKKQEHLSVEEYKTKKEIEKIQKNLEEIKKLPLNKVLINKGRLLQLEELEKEYFSVKDKITSASREVEIAKDTIKKYSTMYSQYVEMKNNIENEINKLANKKVEALQSEAISFIKKNGMQEAFEKWHTRESVVYLKNMK